MVDVSRPNVAFRPKEILVADDVREKLEAELGLGGPEPLVKLAQETLRRHKRHGKKRSSMGIYDDREEQATVIERGRKWAKVRTDGGVWTSVPRGDLHVGDRVTVISSLSGFVRYYRLKETTTTRATRTRR